MLAVHAAMHAEPAMLTAQAAQHAVHAVPQGDFAWSAQRTGHAAPDWRLLQRVSCQNPEGFWAEVIRELGVAFETPPSRVLQEGAPDDPDR